MIKMGAKTKDSHIDSPIKIDKTKQQQQQMKQLDRHLNVIMQKSISQYFL